MSAGIIITPYLKNSFIEILTPLSRHILTHINPASAPMNVKSAPKLLPIISENMQPRLTTSLTTKDGFSRTRVKRMVMGWLLTRFDTSDDKKPVYNVAGSKLVEILARPFAKISSQPERNRFSTMIKDPMTNGIIFQGICRNAGRWVISLLTFRVDR